MAIDRHPPPSDANAAGALLTVDLAALRANYRKLKEISAPAECAACVKGNAYGTGMEQTVKALQEEGCHTFFVAQVNEALRVRNTAPDAIIYVLNGLADGHEQLYVDQVLRPVLGNLGEMENWANFCRIASRPLPAAVHVDTGINRLGLSESDVRTLAGAPDLCGAFEWSLVMSHLACADDPDSAMNLSQRDRFMEARRLLPDAPASFANSAGTLNGAPYHFDMVRPGIALYGGNPFSVQSNPMTPVVSLRSTVLQVRDVPTGGTVGYGAVWKAQRPSKIAVVPVGYFDGFFRSLFNRSDQGSAGVLIGGRMAPLAGRVSMDMITVDVTDIAGDKIGRGTVVELMGQEITVDDIARWAGTVPYEILTALGSRYGRSYLDQSPEQRGVKP